MSWFPSYLKPEESGWRFDILILLAVIGSAATQKHIPAITATTLSVIPRLLPSPETLLGTDRASRLPALKNVKVVGIQSGTLTHELNYFANLIHNVESLEQYTVRKFDIGYRTGDDLESKGDTDQSPSEKEVPPLRINYFSWLNVATVLSILMTVGLFVAAGVLRDGVALLALATMACSTSAASFSAWWSPELSERTAKCEVPRADIAIITRGGAFIIVHCEEQIARELYMGADVSRYTLNGRPHQIVLATSTLLLMASVVFFSNCSGKMQIAIGAAYFILNILYWLLALLVEPRKTWNLEHRYHVEEQELKYEGNKNFTNALWLAIRHTGQTRWAKRADIVPVTDSWEKWLEEARQNAGNPFWPAIARKNELMRQAKFESDVFDLEQTVSLRR